MLIVTAGISSASAQRASADNERANGEAAASSAGDAATSNNAAAAASNRAAAVAAGAPRSPSEFTDFYVNAGGTIPAPTPEQQKADAEAHAAWQARCRPTVVVDREGLRRTKYAEPDCDLLRIRTAGTR
ncbi:hypothetical protein KMZ93_16600 [Bradyrhizobium sediminis]|uniref:Uncharacterized protein n=1 Tax=Bradyrhizobium sediminis TaxID=2840469 RepID=A0A975RW08_9BRAD|nr:hypothetical protein [Bradyrhizobium sediminis]QWG21613.1 hypothetical protein KMZ93_16600 [Bradyrhizobium sediminis]